MPRRTVLTVAGATGPDAALDGVLAPLNFGPADVATSLDDAIDHLRQTHYDLCFLPMEAMDGASIGRKQRS